MATIRPPRHPSGFMFSLSDSLDVPFTSAMTFVISSVPSQTGERVIAVPEAAALQCFGAFLGPFSLFNTQLNFTTYFSQFSEHLCFVFLTF